MGKPIICVDFDGVIHSYERGWQNGEIYGDITPGFWEWAAKAQDHFKLVVYSSRSSTKEGLRAMQSWFQSQWDSYKQHLAVTRSVEPTWVSLEFTHEKPPAFLTIDDRAVRFDGNWNAPELAVDAMQDFKPWTMRK